MTRIVKLEMKGFKSFAKNTDLLFGDDFNVILGPNGSGKSNVIDALTFVLGKSSAKSLRAEKSANLIYNGGKTKNPAKEGEVSIFFTNENKEFPLDTKEVKVTRVVRASGQSIYKINDKKHTRTEIVDLLHYAKINPDGYNIILQGDIIRLVEMSGNERRGIVEEIADISVYEEKKVKALRELDKVETSMKEASIILKERKSYLNDLSGEREQAKKYGEYEEIQKRGKATIINTQISEKKKKIDSIHDKNKEATKKHKQLEEELSQLKEAIKEKKEEIAQINKKIEEQGDARQVQLHKEIEQLKVTIATNQNKIDSIKEEMSRLKERKSQIKDNKKEITDKVLLLQKNAKETESKYNRQGQLKAEISEKIKQFRKKHNMEGATDIEAKIDEYDKQIDDEQRNIDELRSQQQDMLRQKDRLEIQIRTADEKIEKVLNVSKEHKKELDILKQKKVEFKKVTVDLSKALNEDSKIASQVGNARSRAHFLNEELAKLQAKKASIQETLGGSLAIAKIIENKNKIGGVHGTISSLGSVDSTYAKALEIAAGSKIKAIVVENDGVAQKCIDFLKSNKLGVATFLPLNKIRGISKTPEAQKAADASGHGFAIDQIKFDNKFGNVFSHVFGSTVVVDSIAIARKIGIGSAKMVTLDGDTADRSGAMSGGFRKAGKTGLSFTNKEVNEKSDKFEKELADQQSILASLESKKVSAEEDISRMRELKATLEGEIIKMEKGLHLDDQDLDVNQKLKKEFDEDLKKVEKSYMELNMKISTVNRNLATIKTQKQRLRDQINEIRNPTKLAELNTFEERQRSLSDEMIRYESELKHMNSQLSNILEPELENIEKVLKQQQREEDSFAEQINKIKDIIKTDKETLKESEEKEKEFYAKFKESFTKRNAAEKEIIALEDKTIKKEESMREFERKTNLVSIEVAKIQAELDVLNNEFEQYEDVSLYRGKSESELKKMVYDAERQLDSIGPVNMKAIEMYDKVNSEYEKLEKKKAILEKEKENVLVMINEIEVRKKDLFLMVYERLNENFQRIFKTISTKGEAYLELENPDQPFEGGVNVKVKLSGKKFMDIRSLSGGEKTMTALAFIFAIQENDPSSFYIMDEVDAALDKRNAEKLAELIRQYSDRAQYIVISHNDGVISAANNLYGVSMDQQAGVSKVVSLKV